jgi:lipoyl(octanoyl) transferase
LRVRRLGRRDYAQVWAEMRRFTERQEASRGGEIWLLEHDPVFTLGQAGRAEHLLAPGTIPVLQTDRGGQVTYHGPGQLVAYILLDLRRAGLGVRSLVQALEQAVIDLLADYQISAERRSGAPGVYVGEAKIAALGLRVRHGCSYHGLSLNVEMDLEPFARINPCGYPGLAVTQLADQGGPHDLERVGNDLLGHLGRILGCGLRDEDPRARGTERWNHERPESL